MATFKTDIRKPIIVTATVRSKIAAQGSYHSIGSQVIDTGVIEWIQCNVKKQWCWDLYSDAIHFYFSHRDDAVRFKLKFADMLS